MKLFLNFRLAAFIFGSSTDSFAETCTSGRKASVSWKLNSDLSEISSFSVSLFRFSSSTMVSVVNSEISSEGFSSEFSALSEI
jgi:hypothetical protein